MTAAVVLACFAGGWVLQRTVHPPERLGVELDRFVLAVALPALVLAKLPDVPLGRAVVVPAAVAWGTLGLAVAAVAAGARAWGWDRRTAGALLLVTPLGNTSFLGLAAVEVLLGASRLGPALAYDQIGSFFGLAAYGSWVASRYGHAAGGWQATANRLLRFPPFLALLASIPLRWWPLPGAVDGALGLAGRLVAPAAMLALGLRFRLALPRRSLRPALWCLAVKMVLLPGAALAAATVAGGRGHAGWEAAVLEAGMPPMVTAGVVAIQAGLDAELVTAVVGGGILVSFVTLPVWAALVS